MEGLFGFDDAHTWVNVEELLPGLPPAAPREGGSRRAGPVSGAHQTAHLQQLAQAQAQGQAPAAAQGQQAQQAQQGQQAEGSGGRPVANLRAEGAAAGAAPADGPGASAGRHLVTRTPGADLQAGTAFSSRQDATTQTSSGDGLALAPTRTASGSLASSGAEAGGAAGPQEEVRPPAVSAFSFSSLAFQEPGLEQAFGMHFNQRQEKVRAARRAAAAPRRRCQRGGTRPACGRPRCCFCGDRLGRHAVHACGSLTCAPCPTNCRQTLRHCWCCWPCCWPRRPAEQRRSGLRAWRPCSSSPRTLLMGAGEPVVAAARLGALARSR